MTPSNGSGPHDPPTRVRYSVLALLCTLSMVTYIDRAFWGRGIATGALSAFLGIVETRPLFAHVAKANLGSIRVLEKCGFKMVGEDRSTVRGETAEEFVYRLDA